MNKKIMNIVIAFELIICVICFSARAPGNAAEALGALGAVAAVDRGEAHEVVEKAAEAFEAAGPIYIELEKIIEETIADDALDEDSEYDAEETEASLGEINAYSDQLRALLNDISELPDDSANSEGKTVRATREYLNSLLNITTDLSSLIKYGIELNEAMVAMDGMYVETESYQEYADAIWTTTNEVGGLLRNIQPPVYLAISHDDFANCINDFRVFAEDFYYAAELEDPLRIYSCIFRLDRIARMFEICGDDLNADLMLQIRQAERRLNGPIAVLHNELTQNLAILINA